MAGRSGSSSEGSVVVTASARGLLALMCWNEFGMLSNITSDPEADAIRL